MERVILLTLSGRTLRLPGDLELEVNYLVSMEFLH